MDSVVGGRWVLFHDPSAFSSDIEDAATRIVGICAALVANPILKCADGATGGLVDRPLPEIGHGRSADSSMAQFLALVGRLRLALPAAVGAWAYLRLDQPAPEALQLVQAAAAGADLLVLDAEGPTSGKYRQAETFARMLRQRAPAARIGLCAAPAIGYPQALPEAQLLACCDFAMPMAYWPDFKQAPAECVTKSAAYKLPTLPAGVVTAPPAEVSAFMAACDSLPGVAFWCGDQLAQMTTDAFVAFREAVERRPAPAATAEAAAAIAAAEKDLQAAAAAVGS